MNYNRPELLDKLAAEYVLGTLRGPARARFERIIKTLPAAYAAVQAWELRLNALAASVPPVAPPNNVWTSIESRIAPPRPTVPTARWLAWLHPALGLALGIVIGIGVVTLAPGPFVSVDRLAQHEQNLPQSYVGLLLDQAGKPAVLASSTRYGNRMTVKILQPIAVPPGKVLRMWALPQDAAGRDLTPFHLGDVPPQGKGEFVMSGTSEQLLSGVQRLGVALHDADAAINLPSEFLLTGHCVKLW